LHNRVLTADNLIKRSWSCNPLCPLYLCIDETTTHLLTQCNYTEVAWNLATQKFKLPSYVIMQARGGPAHWVQFFSASGGLSGRKEIKGSLIIKRTQFYSLPSCCKRPFDFKDWPGTTPNVGYVACFLSALRRKIKELCSSGFAVARWSLVVQFLLPCSKIFLSALLPRCRPGCGA
jgi:hypothetical protein